MPPQYQRAAESDINKILLILLCPTLLRTQHVGFCCSASTVIRHGCLWMDFLVLFIFFIANVKKILGRNKFVRDSATIRTDTYPGVRRKRRNRKRGKTQMQCFI